MTDAPVDAMTVDQPVIQPCGQCKQPHITRLGNPSCRAHSRRKGGGPCGRDPMLDQRVCATHGGRAAQARAAAAKRRTEAEVKERVAAFGVPRDADPRDALAEEVARTLGAIDWLGSELRALAPAQVFTLLGEHPYLVGWRWERTHLRQLCRDVVGLGIADRGSRVAEQVGGLLVQVLDRLLDDLELTQVQRARLVEVVPAALRQITP